MQIRRSRGCRSTLHKLSSAARGRPIDALEQRMLLSASGDPEPLTSHVGPLARTEASEAAMLQAGPIAGDPSNRGGGPYNPQTVGDSFLATQLSDTPPYVPPDGVGDVGPSQILVVTNGRIKSFDKAGNPGGLNETTDTFFDSVRDGAATGEPRVRYDRLSTRWFVVMTTFNGLAANHILIAVSNGSNITGHSSFYFFQFQGSGSFDDNPSLGVDKFALYIGVNSFVPGGNFNGTQGIIVNKANLVAKTPTLTVNRFALGSTGIFSPQGVDNDDPSATEGYFIGVGSTPSVLELRRVSNPGGTPTLSGNIAITVPSTVLPIAQPALGSTGGLSAIDDRLFAAEITRNKLTGAVSLWTAHNIQVNAGGIASSTGGRNGARWYEINNLTGTPALVQSGTLFDPAGLNPRGFWIPSVAANGQGAMAIASSTASANDQAGIAVAGRLASDPAGTLQPFTLAQAPGGPYNVNDGHSPHRWGDWSQTVVDPTDDMTMWTFQEYANATNSWGIRAIKLAALPPATPISTSGGPVVAGSVDINVTLTGASTNGSGFFSPGSDVGGPGFTNRIVATVNGGGVTLNTIFVSTTQITLNLYVDSNATPGSRTITVTNPDGQSATSASGILVIAAPPGAIAGQKFQDNNGNGIFDAGEPTLNGVTIFLDNDLSGTLNGTEPSVVTSGSGNYSFTGLPDGTYPIREIAPAGFVNTTPALSATVSGGAVIGKNVGGFPIVYTGTAGNDNYTLSLIFNSGVLVESINDGTTTFSIDPSSLVGQGLTFNTLGGDDTLTVNSANGSPVPSGGITYSAGAQTNGAGDTLAIIGGASADTATFDSSMVSFGGTINHTGVETFNCDLAGGLDTVAINTGAVNFTATQQLASLTIAAGAAAKLAAGGSKVIKTAALSMTGGLLDLADNAMILDYTGATQLSTVVGLIMSARLADGSWAGATGITSASVAMNPFAAALGVIENNVFGVSVYTTFFGLPVDPTAILVRYTRNGDSNLDGITNTTDFTSIATNFNRSDKSWRQGDFDFNGNVNALDFNTLATNYGLPSPAPSVQESPVVLPPAAAAPTGSLFTRTPVTFVEDTGALALLD